MPRDERQAAAPHPEIGKGRTDPPTSLFVRVWDSFHALALPHDEALRLHSAVGCGPDGAGNAIYHRAKEVRAAAAGLNIRLMPFADQGGNELSSIFCEYPSIVDDPSRA
jgi:hypothetical protein